MCYGSRQQILVVIYIGGYINKVNLSWAQLVSVLDD